jgi:hypothetical protein
MKVYIVMYENNEKGIYEIMEVFNSMRLASEYIWDWNRRDKWIEQGYNLDDFYWVEKDLHTNTYTGIGH